QSSASRLRMRRPMRIRASSGSSTSCRSPPPTRWIATGCTAWRKNGSEARTDRFRRGRTTYATMACPALMCRRLRGDAMSTLVEFPIDTYKDTAFRNFDPGTANFTIDNARALMWAAQLAYENATTIETVRQQLGFTSVIPFVRHKIGIAGSFETRGIIGERPDAVVLAFAGTDPAVWQNLATDFNLRPRGAGDTHVGFQQAADGAQTEFDQAVQLSRRIGKPLFITGHSLGAALAVLAAQRADAIGTPPKAVYVFGMPRTGGEQFRIAYD